MATRLVLGRPHLVDENDNVVGIRDMNDDQDHLFVFDGEPANSLRLDTTPDTSRPLQSGEIRWNVDEGTIEFLMNSGFATQQVGLETYYRVKNQTGDTLLNGRVVMAVGAVGNSGHISVDYMQGDGSVSAIYLMGVLTHDIPAGDDGFATHFGVVRGINTTGSTFSEDWDDGTVLWAHPTIPGGLTKTEPTAPAIKVPVAFVISSHAVTGSIFVRPTHGSRLNDLHNVQITNPQAGDVLTFNGTAWVNTAP